eukprot:GHVQ01008057.1.p1 GENE.GHVQ01008057.1~~GHVQ01008057.1.p1  ORF type:complete len:938 (+),score=59.15 GHVQ01008057.1:242-3055(+)
MRVSGWPYLSNGDHESDEKHTGILRRLCLWFFSGTATRLPRDTLSTASYRDDKMRICTSGKWILENNGSVCYSHKLPVTSVSDDRDCVTQRYVTNVLNICSFYFDHWIPGERGSYCLKWKPLHDTVSAFYRSTEELSSDCGGFVEYRHCCLEFDRSQTYTLNLPCFVASLVAATQECYKFSDAVADRSRFPNAASTLCYRDEQDRLLHSSILLQVPFTLSNDVVLLAESYEDLAGRHSGGDANAVCDDDSSRCGALVNTIRIEEPSASVQPCSSVEPRHSPRTASLNQIVGGPQVMSAYCSNIGSKLLGCRGTYVGDVIPRCNGNSVSHQSQISNEPAVGDPEKMALSAFLKPSLGLRKRRVARGSEVQSRASDNIQGQTCSVSGSDNCSDGLGGVIVDSISLLAAEKLMDSGNVIESCVPTRSGVCSTPEAPTNFAAGTSSESRATVNRLSRNSTCTSAALEHTKVSEIRLVRPRMRQKRVDGLSFCPNCRWGNSRRSVLAVVYSNGDLDVWTATKPEERGSGTSVYWKNDSSVKLGEHLRGGCVWTGWNPLGETLSIVGTDRVLMLDALSFCSSVDVQPEVLPPAVLFGYDTLFRRLWNPICPRRSARHASETSAKRWVSCLLSGAWITRDLLAVLVSGGVVRLVGRSEDCVATGGSWARLGSFIVFEDMSSGVFGGWMEFCTSSEKLYVSNGRYKMVCVSFLRDQSSSHALSRGDLPVGSSEHRVPPSVGRNMKCRDVIFGGAVVSKKGAIVGFKIEQRLGTRMAMVFGLSAEVWIYDTRNTAGTRIPWSKRILGEPSSELFVLVSKIFPPDNCVPTSISFGPLHYWPFYDSYNAFNDAAEGPPADVLESAPFVPHRHLHSSLSSFEAVEYLSLVRLAVRWCSPSQVRSGSFAFSYATHQTVSYLLDTGAFPVAANVAARQAHKIHGHRTRQTV